jgi:hypothetical protein
VSRFQRNGSLWPYSRISRPKPLLFLPSSSSVDLRGWVDPVPDLLLLRKSASAGNQSRELWICSQELWPLDHRGHRRNEIKVENGQRKGINMSEMGMQKEWFAFEFKWDVTSCIYIYIYAHYWAVKYMSACLQCVSVACITWWKTCFPSHTFKCFSFAAWKRSSRGHVILRSVDEFPNDCKGCFL